MVKLLMDLCFDQNKPRSSVLMCFVRSVRAMDPVLQASIVAALNTVPKGCRVSAFPRRKFHLVKKWLHDSGKVS